MESVEMTENIDDEEVINYSSRESDGIESESIYTTEDGSRYFLWYQDNTSIQMAVNTAKLLGINGVSLWRLGNIPAYDSWNWMESLA